MKKNLVLLGASLFLLAGCGDVPKLSNGEDAVITFENGDMISVDDLYEKMKDTFALESLITLGDTYIFEKEFPDYIDTAKEYAQAYVDAYIEQYDGDEDAFLQDVQSAGYSTIEAYQNYIYLNYMQTHAIEEYAKDQIEDKDIEKYYNDELKGDIELSHILITPEVTDSKNDEEKKAAEDAAKQKVNEVIDKLKNAEDVEAEFSNLAKEYSDDDATKDKGGSLGRITYHDLGDEYDELLDAAYKLKDGEYSTNVITTELGYHIILRTKSYEKEPLEDLKDEIIEKLAIQYSANHRDISIVALRDYRERYGMNIEDDELQKQYARYIQNILASYQTDNSEQ